MKDIDINCDLGEGMENDHLIMPYLSSCNISCGAHAGNPDIITHTLVEAKEHGVKIGAHPSYPDRENFGRVSMNMSTTDLEESIKEQLFTFTELAKSQELALHHIKPHGALYNRAAVHEETATVIVNIMKRHFPELILYVPYGSVIASLASRHGLKIWFEAFADRNYDDDLSLVPRSHPQALLQDAEDIITHTWSMVENQQVKTLSGNIRNLKVDTLCIHGDNPNAVNIAKSIYDKFLKHT